MSKKAISLPERVIDELQDRMATRLAELPDRERPIAEKGMAIWLDEVLTGIEQDGHHADLLFTLPAPHVHIRKPSGRHGSGARIDPRSLEVVVLIARGPGVDLGVPVLIGQDYGELLRVRVRDLVLRDGTRVDTAATVREVLAQTKIDIPDDIGPMLDAWDREDEQA